MTTLPAPAIVNPSTTKLTHGIRICATSDFHGHLAKIKECDLCLIGGDIFPTDCNDPDAQAGWTKRHFLPWMEALGCPVFWTAGNHDFIAEEEPDFVRENNCRMDELVEVLGLKIWFSPWSLTFGVWPFMDSESNLCKKYYNIPNVDIIVSHGPAMGILDKNIDGQSCGSYSLLSHTVDRLPSLLICGHIHEAYGRKEYEGITWANVSHCDENYRPVNDPMYFEVTPRS